MACLDGECGVGGFWLTCVLMKGKNARINEIVEILRSLVDGIGLVREEEAVFLGALPCHKFGKVRALFVISGVVDYPIFLFLNTGKAYNTFSSGT